MKKQRGSTVLEVLALIILLAGGTGWVKNVIKLSDCDFEAPYKAEVIHTIGLIPPIGAITGYLSLGK
jgi:hypothetical protein